jgi:hypothetical protein
MAIAQMGIGAIQTGVAAAEAGNLPEPQKYTVSPELRKFHNLAFQQAQEGWTPQEVSREMQERASANTGIKSMFRNIGLSAAGGAAAGIMGVERSNAFAAQGAANRRQGMGYLQSAVSGIQGINDMEVGRFNQRLLQEEQALGQAVQSGIGNVFGGLDAGANFMQTSDAIATYDKIGKGGTGGSGKSGDGGDFNVDQLPSWLQKMGSNKGWWD